MQGVIKLSTVIFLGALTSISSADDYLVSVCRLQANDNGQAYLRPCNSWASKNNCSSNGWITWSIGSEPGKMMYSTALTAFAAQKTVTVRMDGSSCSGYDVTSMIRVNRD